MVRQAGDEFVRYEDRFFTDGTSNRDVWRRYCGFLDLSVEEFSRIQQGLLREQIGDAGKAVSSGDSKEVTTVHSIDELRRVAPLTRYADYEPYLRSDGGEMAGEKPGYWVHTSASEGTFKRVPWASRFNEVQRRNVISAMILSSAREPGDIALALGARVLNLLPGKPFASALLGSSVTDQFSIRPIPPLEIGQRLTFSKKMDTAIMMGLKSDVDYVVAMTSSLLRLGQRFGEVWNKIKYRPVDLLTLHPQVALRLLSSNHRGNMLPKSAWAVKGVVSWGADSSVFEKIVEQHWGKKPLQMYGSSEGGIMAIQDWRRGSMAFLPDSVFLEFIPEESINANNPPTLLIDEVKEGKAYELVITHFYGMPFVRYRQGDLVRMVRDGVQGNGVPRMVFLGRADDTIDVFGIARLNTKVVAEALGQVGLSGADWCLRKEYDSGRVILKLFVELAQPGEGVELERRLSKALKTVDQHWAEAVYTMAYNPLRLQPLPPGTFRRLGSRFTAGSMRINPPDSIIRELVHPGDSGP